MKIISTDNLDREYVSDRLVASGITRKDEGEVMLAALRASCKSWMHDWFELVEDDRPLRQRPDDDTPEPGA